MTYISYICHYNDEQRLQKCLIESLKSNMKKKDELFLLKDYKSQASAYAYAEKEAKNDLMVFVHQDTYLPKGWRRNLIRQIKILDTVDKDWGIIGCIGLKLPIFPSEISKFVGHFGDEYGEFCSKNLPMQVDTVDSFMFAKRKNGIHFDPKIPSFHGAIEDICYQAKKDSKGVWIPDIYTEHRTNKQGVDSINLPEIIPARDYLIKKWGLPIVCGNILWKSV